MEPVKATKNPPLPKGHNMSAQKSVTVIGLGPMGRATVKVLLAAGVDVTVWNRTPAKADALAELGAKPAATVAEALAANDIVLLSLIHYDAMYGVLEQGPADLTGKTIVNLSSDSPAKARKGAEWVIERGARFLTGAYMTQSDDIRHPASRLYVSGPEHLYDVPPPPPRRPRAGPRVPRRRLRPRPALLPGRTRHVPRLPELARTGRWPSSTPPARDVDTFLELTGRRREPARLHALLRRSRQSRAAGATSRTSR